jgi:hypothetical protein
MPKVIAPVDYEPTSTSNRASQMGKSVSINSGHRRLIGKARRKYEAGDMRSAAELAQEFGGDRNWWGKIVVYAQSTPKFLQVNSANQLKGYINEVMPQEPEPVGADRMMKPTQKEPMGVMDEIGLGEPTREPTLKELNDLWLKSQEPEPQEPDPIPDLVFHDLLTRVESLETMLGQVFTHLMES